MECKIGEILSELEEVLDVLFAGKSYQEIAADLDRQ